MTKERKRFFNGSDFNCLEGPSITDITKRSSFVIAYFVLKLDVHEGRAAVNQMESVPFDKLLVILGEAGHH